jgi:hypothetical protein
MGLSLDGQGQVFQTSGSSSTASLTTVNAGDVIVAVASTNGTNDITGVHSPTLGAFTLRTNDHTATAGGRTVSIYYAVSSGTLSSEAVKASYSDSVYSFFVTFGVSGANTSTPFDPNAAVPSFNTGSGSTGSSTFSTTNANTFIFQMASWSGLGSWTAGGVGGTGATAFGTLSSSNYWGIQYQIVAASESGASFSIQNTNGSTWMSLVDAIQQASPVTTNNLSYMA